MAQQSESQAKQAALDLAAAEARLVDLLGATDADTLAQAVSNESTTGNAGSIATLDAIQMTSFGEAAPTSGSIGDVVNLGKEDDSDWAKAEKMAGCAQHSGCRDLEGLCCPTHLGRFLECCGTGVATLLEQPTQPTQDLAPVRVTNSPPS